MTTQQENVMQLLKSALMVGVMITTTVAYIYAQGPLHGIHLETIHRNFAQYFVHKVFMQIVTQEQDNV